MRCGGEITKSNRTAKIDFKELLTNLENLRRLLAIRMMNRWPCQQSGRVPLATGRYSPATGA